MSSSPVKPSEYQFINPSGHAKEVSSDSQSKIIGSLNIKPVCEVDSSSLSLRWLISCYIF